MCKDGFQEIDKRFRYQLDLPTARIGSVYLQLSKHSYHLGYHLAFGKNKRFFIEPQVHCQHWMFDSKSPAGFRELDDKWRNYFLFEPNLYFGVKF